MASEELVSFEVTEQTPTIRFLASLSDGRTVIQDDRPGIEHAWFRLGKLLRANQGLRITCLRVQHGEIGEGICMPTNQPGYVFGRKGAMALGGPQVSAVGAGYFDGQTCVIQWVAESDLSPIATETQTSEQCGFKLIRNPA